jgi:hypothetical protein
MFVLFGVKHVILSVNYLEFAMKTWSSANNTVFNFVSFDIFIPVVYFSLQCLMISFIDILNNIVTYS